MIYASRFLRYEAGKPIYGPDVREVQAKLAKLGYYENAIDGVFGIKTEEALLRFQKEYSIIADGIVGKDTWNIFSFQTNDDGSPLITQAKLPHINIDLNKRQLTFFRLDKTSKTYKVAVGRPSNPTPLGNWVIVQKSLNPGGPFGARWMRLSVPWGGYGIHGTNNPNSIGKAVSHGCIRLYNEDVIEIYNFTPLGTPVTITGSGYSAKPLKKGDEGKDVRKIQKMLKKLGYYKYRIDGKFGEKTEQAVMRFQTKKGLLADGIVGPVTYETLYKAYDKATKNTAP